ncbi:MAG: DUF5606 domain-containing protein [Bacteroidia bacterium]|nr:DUF5606 domain-containing protein [Bacteroidia bacterium]
MELKDIVSVSGMTGLYKIAGQRKNGLIVEALDGSGKKIPTSATSKISVLSEIAMFTKDGEERLSTVLLRLKDNNIEIPEKKADDASFKEFMEKALPNYDSERVYISDIKKLASWFTILKDQFDFEKLKQSDAAEEAEIAAEEGKTDEKVKKSTKKTDKPVAKTAVKSDSKSKGKAVGQVRKMA